MTEAPRFAPQSRFNVSDIQCASLNINGVQQKLGAIAEYIKREKLDLLILQESWLSKERKYNINFTPIVDLREETPAVGRDRAGGGILIYAAARIKQLISNIKPIEIDKGVSFIIGGKAKIITMYIKPSLSKVEMSRLWQVVMTELREDAAIPTIIVGDFNARMGAMVGDHATNRGGIVLRDLLSDEPGLSRLSPMKGKFTIINSQGMGITDHILTWNDTARRGLVTQLVIQESDAIGGTDHRPLRFQMNTEGCTTYMYDRWNTSKLKKNPLALPMFIAEDASLRAMIRGNRITIARLESNRRSGRLMTWQERQGIVDAAADQLITIINKGLNNTCGKFKESIRSNKDFMTPKMLIIKRQMEEAHAAASLATVAGAPRTTLSRLWKAYGKFSKLWRRRCERRVTVVFTSSIDILSTNSNTIEFNKMVSASRKKETRSICHLDSNQMNTHAEHYTATFGGAPSGMEPTSRHDLRFLEQSNPELGFIPMRCKGKEKELVSAILNKLPNNKAAGIDMLPAEALKQLNELISEPLHQLFSMCEMLAVIPKSWTQTLVAPIYKHKGEITDIKNYRPIALTCVLRRAYEQYLLPEFDSKIAEKLTMNQGGFLDKRGTIDQVYRLHEHMAHKKQLVLILLDIKAAFDTVDRRRVWIRLHQKFKLKCDTIRRLRSLMDYNNSFLCINGKRSNEIPNRRGFLQGSSISPKLFNPVIDELSEMLNTDTQSGLSLHGIRINHLMFADDTALLAKSWKASEKMLKTCEEWQEVAGMEFAPAKCIYITKGLSKPRSGDRALKINGIELHEATEATYLGIEFTEEGINFNKNFKNRFEKCRRAANFLRAKGCNAFGWRPNRQRLIMTAYIRPRIEYGLEMAILKTPISKQIIQEENQLLRSLTSFNKTTSGDALNFIFGLDSLKSRNHYRNACYMHEVLHGSRKDHPVGELANALLRNRRKLAPNSLMLTFLQKNYFREVVLGTRPSEEEARDYNVLTLLADHAKSGKIGKSVSVECLGHPDPIVQHAVHLERIEVFTVLQLKLGKLGSYKPCKRCNELVTQNHLLRCGVNRDTLINLAARCDVEIVILTQSNRSIIQEITNVLDREVNFDPEKYRSLATLLIEAKELCMEWKRDFRSDASESRRTILATNEDDQDPRHPLNKRKREALEAESKRNKRRRRR